MEDDNLEIVGVMPVMKKELDILQVKTEETTPPVSPKKGASEETGEQKNAPPLESPEKVASEDKAGKEDASPQKAATEGDAGQAVASPQESPQKSTTEDKAGQEDGSPLKPSQKEKAKPKKHLGTTTMTKRTLRSHKT